MSKDLRASIDIGSNSVLLLIADVTNNTFNELKKEIRITSLGKNLDKTKMFADDSIAATTEALKIYVDLCVSHGVKTNQIIATATEAARIAKNASDYFSQIEQDLGLKIHIISAQAEAYFSTKGILFNSKFEKEIITIMDIGGASTELIKVNTKTFQILKTISMPVGAVRATQWLDDDTFVQNLQKIFIDYRIELDEFQSKEIFCVAGTVTSLGNMHLENKEFIEDEVHGLKLKIEEVEILFKKFSSYEPEKFLEQFPFLQKRAASIKGGLHIVYHLCHRLLASEMIISTYGLRYGTILEGSIKEEFLNGRNS